MLTIGEFSRLGRISARMLRHYDIIGLLRPAHVGAENGYRYYDPAQLAVLAQITRLKGYGFSLAEIESLLPLPQHELARRIHARRLAAYAELNEMRQNLRQMEEQLLDMEGTDLSFEKYHVIVMDAPAQKVFAIRRTINISEIHALFQELAEEMARRGIKRTGPTQYLYMGEEFSYDAMDLEAQAQVDEDGEGVRTIPAGTFAATTHIGPYETVKYAYDAIAAWMAEHPEYEVCGPAIERYLKDEDMANSPEELETGILFPIRRK